MTMATKLGGMVIFHEVFPSIKSYDPLFRWSCKVTWQITCHFSTTTRTMAIKLQGGDELVSSKVVSCYQGLPPTK